jgi:hypothetical protein
VATQKENKYKPTALSRTRKPLSKDTKHNLEQEEYQNEISILTE